MSKYELSKTYKKIKYAREYLEYLETLSDEDLLDEVFSAQSPDDYDGGFTNRGHTYMIISQEYLRYLFLERSKNENSR